jgi:hypothetical protein
MRREYDLDEISAAWLDPPLASERIASITRSRA